MTLERPQQRAAGKGHDEFRAWQELSATGRTGQHRAGHHREPGGHASQLDDDMSRKDSLRPFAVDDALSLVEQNLKTVPHNYRRPNAVAVGNGNVDVFYKGVANHQPDPRMAICEHEGIHICCKRGLSCAWLTDFASAVCNMSNYAVAS